MPGKTTGWWPFRSSRLSHYSPGNRSCKGRRLYTRHRFGTFGDKSKTFVMDYRCCKRRKAQPTDGFGCRCRRSRDALLSASVAKLIRDCIAPVLSQWRRRASCLQARVGIACSGMGHETITAPPCRVEPTGKLHQAGSEELNGNSHAVLEFPAE